LSIMKSNRTIIILVDCLQTTKAGPFNAGSEGEFLLRLGSLLAASEAGRVLVCSVVTVPTGESVSAYSVAAQARRQVIEKQALGALSQASGDAVAINGKDGGTPTQPPRTLIAPVVRV